MTEVFTRPRPRIAFPRTSRIARSRRRRLAVGANLVAVIALAFILFLMRQDDRVIAAPMLALAEIAFFYLTTFWTRDGEIPLFEAGTLWVLSTSIYGIMALLGFLQMQGSWYPRSDFRLHAYPFVPSELGLFGWRYVVYLATFVVVYIAIRRGARIKRVPMPAPSAATVTAMVVLFVALWLFRSALRGFYGYTIVSYEHLEDVAANLQQVPYLLQQIGHNLLSALLIVQQALLILLMTLWRHRLSRVIVVIWLTADIAMTASHFGARTATVLLLLSAALIYHRLVKPISLPKVVVGGALLLSGFLIVGNIRNTLGSSSTERGGLLTTVNEFQAIFTNAFDLQKRRELGTLPPVPWQIYAVDLYLPIPSQLLPFEKIEPATWYADSIGLGGRGVGFMFGVMAQAAVGLGWLELVLRAGALAVVFALLHRWYVRRAAQFWPTLFYLFLAIWTYYTFRATSFWFVYFIVYQFLPVMLTVKLLELSLKRVLPRRERSEAAAS